MARRKTTISAKWKKLMQLIPGYDPIATAPPGYWFDVETAETYCDFFPEMLQHVKGPKGGEPFVLEPWQQAMTGCLFGWKRPDGTRRYRTLFDYVPRKNGKTPWAAGVVIAVMIIDDEMGMEIYSGASDIEQAALVFQYAQGMVLREPMLKERLKIFTATKTFEYAAKYAYYRVLSGDKGTNKHGKNVYLGILDETHAHKSPELIDVIQTGTAARTQPLIIHTTTADWLRESVCNELYDYACNVRDRVIDDPHFLPVIYEAVQPDSEEPDELWWTKEEVWKQANPNYGISVQKSYIEEACKEAINTPRKRNTFKRLHLNIRTGQDTDWLGLEKWDACLDKTLDLGSLKGEKCYGGLDLASNEDFIALVLYFPNQQTYIPYFWLPLDTVRKRVEKSGVPYNLWVDQGYIQTTPGNVADYDYIRTAINELRDEYLFQQIAIDRHNATHLMTQLGEDGFDVVPFGQGFLSMSAPSKELERLVIGGQLRHDGNPVMRWQASHIAIDMDPAGNIKPSKKTSSEKIDGFVALVEAIGIAMVAETEKRSVYETRGLIRL